MTPDEAVRHTMKILRSTNPSQPVLDVIEQIESEIDNRCEVEEVTPEQARVIALHEIEQAKRADSLDHMIMHLESALIWARGAGGQW